MIQNIQQAAQGTKSSINALGCRLLWAVAASALLLPACTGSVTEPTYGGKTLSTWAAESVSLTSPEKREPACQAIRHMGTNALPFLLHELAAVESLWPKAGSTNSSSMETIKRKGRIDSAFQALGPIALPAVPALLDRIKEERDPAQLAVTCLVHVAPQTADALFVEQLTNASWKVRIRAADHAVLLGTNAVRIVPPLIQQVQQAETTDTQDARHLKQVALATLGGLGSHPEQLVTLGRECLKDKDWMVRLAALNLLRRLGTSAQAAIPDLQECAQHDPHPRVQSLAQTALKSLSSGQSASQSSRKP